MQHLVVHSGASGKLAEIFRLPAYRGPCRSDREPDHDPPRACRERPGEGGAGTDGTLAHGGRRPGAASLAYHARAGRPEGPRDLRADGPVRQGSRMSVADDELEHVVVVPGGLLAPAA